MGKVTFYFGIHDGTEECRTPRNQTEEVYEIDCEYYFATKVLRCMTMVFKDWIRLGQLIGYGDNKLAD